MDDMFILRKKHFDGACRVQTVRIGEKVDALYGAEFFTIAPEDLEALTDGKVLTFWINAEYAVYLKYQK